MIRVPILYWAPVDDDVAADYFAGDSQARSVVRNAFWEMVRDGIEPIGAFPRMGNQEEALPHPDAVLEVLQGGLQEGGELDLVRWVMEEAGYRNLVGGADWSVDAYALGENEEGYDLYLIELEDFWPRAYEIVARFSSDEGYPNIPPEAAAEVDGYNDVIWPLHSPATAEQTIAWLREHDYLPRPRSR